MAKRRLPPHIVLPNGQWRFVKRGHKGHKHYSALVKHHKKVIHTAKRHSYRRYGRKAIGGLKGFIWPVAAGLADSYLDPMIPGLDGLGATAIGFISHDSALKTIGLYKIGHSISGFIPLPGMTQMNTGGLL